MKIAVCPLSKVEERVTVLSPERASPLARPNQVLVELADAAMAGNGRMARAIEETGRGLQFHGVDENVPFELSGLFPSKEVW